ncbi:hypothetical protein TWF730_006199 [Orbilia blumenaviensis]|uniref:Uncharacterized protein n=1 Tax=Orbilia blumenaviensis TaxID=1796055 RepID=A0AAV9U083_9PEZI
MRQSLYLLITTLLLLFTLPTHAANPFVYQYRNENAHIAYKGDVSITWNTFTKAGNPCTIQLGPQNHSWFYIGLHPNWDPNPLFFELSHVSSVKCDSRGENCVDFDSTTSKGFFIYTNDEIYNLEFASSVVELNFDRGESGEYELQRTVDFGKAKVGRVDGLDGDGDEKGYRVQLGKDSWLNNNTYEPGVTLDYQGNQGKVRDFENGCFLDPKYSIDFMTLEWTGIHDDFGIDFTFTNQAAKASFYLKANRTEMTLTFTGKRNISENTNQLWDYPEIDLDTSDPDMPGFNWRGGGGGPVAFGGDAPSRLRPTVVGTEMVEATSSVSRNMMASRISSSTSIEAGSTTGVTSSPSPSKIDLSGDVTSSDSLETAGPTSSQSGPGPETSIPSSGRRHAFDFGTLWALLLLCLTVVSMSVLL